MCMCKSIMTAVIRLLYNYRTACLACTLACMRIVWSWKAQLVAIFLQMSSENVLEMVRLYSHCSCRYLTLLLVNGRYAYANFVSLAVLLFLFPRVFRRCIVTAARPQEHGGVPHLRRDDVRARGRPDGSNALQYARRTNVQVRKNKICIAFLCMSLVSMKSNFRIKSPPFKFVGL